LKETSAFSFRAEVAFYPVSLKLISPQNGIRINMQFMPKTEAITILVKVFLSFFLGYVIPVVYAKLISRKGAVYNTTSCVMDCSFPAYQFFFLFLSFPGG